MGGSAERQLSTVTSGEGNSGSVDLPPLHRATIYPGECCVCGRVILMASIRCDEHEEVYQRGRQWDRAMPGSAS